MHYAALTQQAEITPTLFRISNSGSGFFVVFQPQSSPRAGIYDHSSAALAGPALRIPEKECVCVCSTEIGLVFRGIRVISFCDLYIRSVSSSIGRRKKDGALGPCAGMPCHSSAALVGSALRRLCMAHTSRFSTCVSDKWNKRS
jgi:hypothetical protein